jgi:hypothetical protein
MSKIPKVSGLLIKYLLLSLFIFVLVETGNAQAPPKPDKIENSTEDLPPIKYAFANVGYGQYKVWAEGGFRYWMFGLSGGVSGVGLTMPPYRTDIMLTQNNIAALETYTKLVIHGEGTIYVDLTPWVSLFGSIGYYSENDSIFARPPYTVSDPDNNLYRYKDNTFGGFCFAAGGQYFFNNQIGVGIGYHTKSGFFVQLGYYWE